MHQQNKVNEEVEQMSVTCIWKCMRVCQYTGESIYNHLRKIVISLGIGTSFHAVLKDDLVDGGLLVTRASDDVFVVGGNVAAENGGGFL